MNIEPFCSEDIAPFLELASSENWVAESWEFEFLLATFPQGCFTARRTNGQSAGFVTSLRHGDSGWIGNLLVAPDHRGQGIGEKLFVAALEALRSAGVDTIWLTASKSGQSLYEKYGFSSVDTIIRWVGTGRQRHGVHTVDTNETDVPASVSHIDYQTWGGRRNTLLTTTVGRGRLLHNDSGFIVIQPCGDGVQFGPFSSLGGSSGAALLFDAAAKSVTLGTRFLVDAPASNRAALRLFNRKKMRIAGSNVLMVAGKNAAYRSDLLYGLATMGSCG